MEGVIERFHGLLAPITNPAFQPRFSDNGRARLNGMRNDFF
jgi:hypothetical protein